MLGNCLFSIIKQLTRKPSLLLLSSDSYLHINKHIRFPPSQQKQKVLLQQLYYFTV